MSFLNLIVMERLRDAAVRSRQVADYRDWFAEPLDPLQRGEIEAAIRALAVGTRYEQIDAKMLTDTELPALERLLREGGDFWDWAVVEGCAARLHCNLDP